MTRPSPWNLLRPRWLLLLFAVIAAGVVMVLLGRWQWHSGRRTGDITNYSYAFQWWAFTVFAIVMYVRAARDYLQSAGSAGETGSGEATAQDVATYSRPAASRPAAPRYVSYTAAPSYVADDDPERARFNRYLASLYDPAERGDTAAGPHHPPTKGSTE